MMNETIKFRKGDCEILNKKFTALNISDDKKSEIYKSVLYAKQVLAYNIKMHSIDGVSKILKALNKNSNFSITDKIAIFTILSLDSFKICLEGYIELPSTDKVMFYYPDFEKEYLDNKIDNLTIKFKMNEASFMSYHGSIPTTWYYNITYDFKTGDIINITSETTNSSISKEELLSQIKSEEKALIPEPWRVWDKALIREERKKEYKKMRKEEYWRMRNA